jgi:hypothetical protein
MVIRNQYQGQGHITSVSPKYIAGNENATQETSSIYTEERDGTTVLMDNDHSTIRTQDDMTLPTRQGPGQFPSWAPALANQKPPKTIEAKSPSKSQTPKQETMDFMKNDNSFHVVASLLVDKFEEALKTEARFIKVTAEDKLQIDRMVPESARENFVAALRYRFEDSPEFSRLPIHTVTRNCHKLGLTRLDEQNILFAPAGTVILLEVSIIFFRNPFL